MGILLFLGGMVLALFCGISPILYIFGVLVLATLNGILEKLERKG